MNKENRIIGYIERGVVIDHIPLGRVWKIAELLKVDKGSEGRVSLGDGYESKKVGRKGFLKIEGKFLSPCQLNLIALVAGNASVSIISEGRVKKKDSVEIPSILENIVLCPNSGCISNASNQKVSPLVNYDLEKGFKCHYCNREFGKDELKFVSY